MNKTELIERFTSQRQVLSQIRGLLREQIEKCQFVTGVAQKRFVLSSNPIIMEVFEASKSVNLAFMWLGKAKGFLGEPHPYKESYNAENKVIEKAVDVLPTPDKNYEGPVEMLKSLRADLKELDRAMSSNLGFAQGDSSEVYEAVQNAFTHFHEGCMWLGVALGNIKDMGVEETIAWRKIEEEDDPAMTISKLRKLAEKGNGLDPENFSEQTQKELKGDDSETTIAKLRKFIDEANGLNPEQLSPKELGGDDSEKKSPIGSIDSPIGSEENKIKTDLQPKSDESNTKGGTKADNPKGPRRSGSNKNEASDKAAGGPSDPTVGADTGKNG